MRVPPPRLSTALCGAKCGNAALLNCARRVPRHRGRPIATAVPRTGLDCPGGGRTPCATFDCEGTSRPAEARRVWRRHASRAWRGPTFVSAIAKLITVPMRSWREPGVRHARHPGLVSVPPTVNLDRQGCARRGMPLANPRLVTREGGRLRRRYEAGFARDPRKMTKRVPARPGEL